MTQRNPESSLWAHVKDCIAHIASHSIFRNRVKGGSQFFVNPATGALEVRPECRGKIEQALWRHARSAQRRLYARQLYLSLQLLPLKARHLILVAKRDLLRCRNKTGRNTHSTLPERKGIQAYDTPLKKGSQS